MRLRDAFSFCTSLPGRDIIPARENLCGQCGLLRGAREFQTVRELVEATEDGTLRLCRAGKGSRRPQYPLLRMKALGRAVLRIHKDDVFGIAARRIDGEKDDGA